MTHLLSEPTRILEAAGGSKTIYALYLPETRAIIDAILDNRDSFHEMYTDAWTKKQDAAHRVFFETWATWARPIVQLDAPAFPFAYPTAGATEAIRESIYAYGHKARQENFAPTIHVFEGEYEGYEAYAEAAHIPLIKHNRQQWPEAIKRIGPNDQFYLSQPSAINGMIWQDYPNFMTALNKAQPTAQVMLDLTYVGCVAKPFNISAAHPNIHTLFFSLSKPFGVYYHRIGGMISRDEHKGLYGNMWFKNLLSLKIGTEMMQTYSVHALPQKYAAQAQIPAAAEVGANLGFNLLPCDVYLMAAARPSSAATPLETHLTRGAGDEARVRVCLTPTMNRIVNASSYAGKPAP